MFGWPGKGQFFWQGTFALKHFLWACGKTGSESALPQIEGQKIITPTQMASLANCWTWGWSLFFSDVAPIRSLGFGDFFPIKSDRVKYNQHPPDDPSKLTSRVMHTFLLFNQWSGGASSWEISIASYFFGINEETENCESLFILMGWYIHVWWRPRYPLQIYSQQ